MNEFTPWSGLAGGILIGLSASMLLVGAGRVAGVSGIAAGALFGDAEDRPWRVAFLIGLLLAGLGFALFLPASLAPSPRPLAWLALAGLLVGVGTQIGNGCTSGHGVCGISRLSLRSIVATVLFLASGMLTVALLRGLGVAP
jgi:uncharacterized membrane protein YedE/YeeE